MQMSTQLHIQKAVVFLYYCSCTLYRGPCNLAVLKCKDHGISNFNALNNTTWGDTSMDVL